MQSAGPDSNDLRRSPGSFLLYSVTIEHVARVQRANAKLWHCNLINDFGRSEENSSRRRRQKSHATQNRGKPVPAGKKGSTSHVRQTWRPLHAVSRAFHCPHYSLAATDRPVGRICCQPRLVGKSYCIRRHRFTFAAPWPLQGQL